MAMPKANDPLVSPGGDPLVERPGRPLAHRQRLALAAALAHDAHGRLGRIVVGQVEADQLAATQRTAYVDRPNYFSRIGCGLRSKFVPRYSW